MNLKFNLLVTVVALLVGPLFVSLVSSAIILSLMAQAVIYALFALGVGVLLRQNGLVSFGHALYFGGAGYLLGTMLNLEIMPVELAIPFTLLALGAFGYVVGLVIVRVPGISFGMLTLSMGQMAFILASRTQGVTGGADGMSIYWPDTVFGVSLDYLLSPGVLLVVCWSALVLSMLVLSLLLGSRFGDITQAVRDNEERARFIGIPTITPRAAIYSLSAIVVGFAGVLASLNTGFVSPETLHWSLSGTALMMVIVGGFKVLWGPPLGAMVYFLFKDILGDYADHWMTILGITLITVIVFFPEGLAGFLQYLKRRLGGGGKASGWRGSKAQVPGQVRA